MNRHKPWNEFADEHRIGEQLTCPISRIVLDMGLLVSLNRKILGIVHLSDLDWESSGEEAVLSYRVGESVKVVILAIEPERQRVCLGIKHLKPDPRQDRRGQLPIPSPVKPKPSRPPDISSAIQRR